MPGLMRRRDGGGAAPSHTPGWRRHKPRLRTVLLAVNLVLLVLPLGGIWLLRLYESALVRQTETELMGQGAVLAAAWRSAWLAAAGQAPAPPPAGWAPRTAMLDLARDPVLPPPPSAVPPLAPPAVRALAAGQALQPVLAEAQRTTLAAMRVLDADGVVVASSGGELGLSLAALEEVAEALSGQPASRLRRRADPTLPVPGPASISRGAALRVFLALPVLDGERAIGAVLLSRTPATLDQALYGHRRALAGLGLGLLAAAALGAAGTAYTVARPIAAVTRAAQAVAAGAPAAPPRPRRSAVREADELAAAIAAMAATLERRAETIRDFATEVGHGFKTPLAGLTGALELLQDHAAAMTPEERARFLGQAMADAARLDRLVRRLLELARAEAPAATGHCRLAEVVREAAAPFRAAGLAIAWPPGEGPKAGISAEALRGILGILFENARQHAGPGAACRVTWQEDADAVTLRVADDGMGIPPAITGQVFDRFFTTAAASGGTGLGLAIARRLAEAAGGVLRLVPAERGACFELLVPAGALPLPGLPHQKPKGFWRP
ncbi:HAMP domain-containing histidine kinase [Siccirubricoccus sp. KC 17139]|uniref:histidine kinase n=1 Tax=Siccirubricoccus soli TaxID=2899147 RepID=A0ABT1DAJ4_9PROT|nr:HAMP domain-containing sensor histidine kinase [Siccirubricoccus soli]MCO6418956.1 HAMP domain-containing histidine kinase [Siccirubricoccus soli]MCP2685091.1 HAMP domain-containing histidine kinase [Siccirubricoccus soli]